MPRPENSRLPMAEGWAAHPYAPRSTQQTLRPTEYRRYRVPAGTVAASCPSCHAPIYHVPGDPEWTDENGTTHADAGFRVDCEPDVAGVIPTPEAWGSGILHGYVCSIPRPLPTVAAGDLPATQSRRGRTR